MVRTQNCSRQVFQRQRFAKCCRHWSQSLIAVLGLGPISLTGSWTWNLFQHRQVGSVDGRVCTCTRCFLQCWGTAVVVFQCWDTAVFFSVGAQLFFCLFVFSVLGHSCFLQCWDTAVFFSVATQLFFFFFLFSQCWDTAWFDFFQSWDTAVFFIVGTQPFSSVLGHSCFLQCRDISPISSARSNKSLDTGNYRRCCTRRMRVDRQFASKALALTPSIAFQHLPPDSAITGYADDDVGHNVLRCRADILGAKRLVTLPKGHSLSPRSCPPPMHAVSAFRKVWVPIL